MAKKGFDLMSYGQPGTPLTNKDLPIDLSKATTKNIMS